VVADKVAGLRAAAHSGAVQLDALRHHAPKIPKPSTLSSRQAALEAAAAAQQQEEEEARQELRRREEEEKEREPDPPIRHFVIAGVAVNYLQLVAKRYAITKSIHRYMHDPVAIAELVRLQRWVRHQRLKKVFFKLLRHRRIVIKALIRYALRFQVRYKHRCANMVLNFFQTCFDEVRAPAPCPSSVSGTVPVASVSLDPHAILCVYTNPVPPHTHPRPTPRRRGSAWP
jgi:hypothetical protein